MPQRPVHLRLVTPKKAPDAPVLLVYRLPGKRLPFITNVPMRHLRLAYAITTEPQ